ncbi:DUF2512 family protein [Bacillus alkalicellulosilyticus]|uniref:DUF2512 family protein n=1 Tax=Alkalihalobacterium alkalicellulosilyticum TaxID=1912214 RepID=UPI001481E229|nr:DUF2512 family protein [Bacillus alkalicellulosilyticus]
MKHITALVIKLVLVTLALLIVMTGFYHYPFGSSFGLAILISVFSYIVGDLGVLRISNNTIATLADLGLNTFIIWLIGPFLYFLPVTVTMAFFAALAICVGEWFLHKFVANMMFERDKEPSPQL